MWEEQTYVKSPVASGCLVCSSVINLESVIMSVWTLSVLLSDIVVGCYVQTRYLSVGKMLQLVIVSSSQVARVVSMALPRLLNRRTSFFSEVEAEWLI